MQSWNRSLLALAVLAACSPVDEEDRARTITLTGTLGGQKVIVTGSPPDFTCTERSNVTGTADLVATVPVERIPLEANIDFLFSETTPVVTLEPTTPPRSCGVVGFLRNITVRVSGPRRNDVSTEEWELTGSTSTPGIRVDFAGSLVGRVLTGEVSVVFTSATGTHYGTLKMPLVMRE